LLILNEEGKYQYTPYHEFYPARYMCHNRVIVTNSEVSMTGIDCDGDQIGVMKIKMEDLFGEDYEAYFLEIYNRLRDEESRREKESKEKRERALYEGLSKKYGETKTAQQNAGMEVQPEKKEEQKMWLVDKMLDMVRLVDGGYDEEDEEYVYEDDDDGEDGGKYSARDRRYASSRETGQEERCPARTGGTDRTGAARLSVRQGSRRDTRKDGVREICLVKPESFEDSADAARYLLAGIVVILDIKGTGADLAQRVVDFLCGTVYAVDGDIKSISTGIFIAAPAGVDLTGEFGDMSTLAGLDSQAMAGNVRWMAAGRAAAGTSPGPGRAQAYQAAV
jgi:cell division inhibitor SepF